MQLAVISGYILASVFALCGLLNTTLFCLYGDARNMTVFLNGVAVCALPLAVGAIILLLVQILSMLAQLHGTAVNGELVIRRNPQKNIIPSQKKIPATRREPQHYFPVSDTGTSSATPQQESEKAFPELQEEEMPHTEEKLQFFKLH